MQLEKLKYQLDMGLSVQGCSSCFSVFHIAEIHSKSTNACIFPTLFLSSATLLLLDVNS